MKKNIIEFVKQKLKQKLEILRHRLGEFWVTTDEHRACAGEATPQMEEGRAEGERRRLGEFWVTTDEHRVCAGEAAPQMGRKRVGVRFLMVGVMLMLMASLSAGQMAAGEIQAIVASGSTRLDSSGYNTIDADPATGWQLTAGSTSGWLEIVLQEPCFITSLTLDSQPGSSRLEIAFPGEGWVPFSGLGHFIPAAGVVSYDLSGDNVVTDRLRLAVSGVDAASYVLRELNLYGHPAVTGRNRLHPYYLFTGLNSDPFNFATNLIDGDIGTVWKTDNSPEYSGYQAAAAAWLRESLYVKQYTDYISSAYASVQLKFRQEQQIEFVHLYTNGNLTGDLMVYVVVGGQTLTAGVLPAASPAGWYRISLAPELQTTLLVLLKITGSAEVKEGLCEVELWSRAGVEGDSHQDLTKDLETIAAESQAGFMFDPGSENLYELQVVTPADPGHPLDGELNGIALELNYSRMTNGQYYFSRQLTGEELKHGYNYLSLLPRSGETLSLSDVRVIERNRLGQYILTGSQLQASGDLTLPLPAASWLHQIYLEGPTNPQLPVDAFSSSQWQPLSCGADGVYTGGVDAIGLPATALRIANPGSEELGRVLEVVSPAVAANPRLTLLNPAEGEALPLSQLPGSLLLGELTGGTNLTLNGQPCGRQGDMFWIPLADTQIGAPGLYDLAFAFTDRQGNPVVYHRELNIKDDSLFEVYPAESDILTTTASLTVYGSVPAGSQASVDINGTPAQMSGDNFSLDVPLVLGYNKLLVNLRDSAAQALLQTVVRHVMRTDDETDILIADPEDGACLNTPSVVVSGTLTESVQAKVIAGEYFAIVNGNHFTSRQLDLNEGANPITVKLMRHGAVLKQKTITVYRDTLAPGLAVASPVAGSYIKNLQVRGTISDSSQVWVSVNNYPAGLTGNTFSATPPLAEGVHDLEVKAADGAGNTTAVMIAGVVYDATPPEAFSLSAEPAGWTHNTRPQLIFSTIDSLSGIDYYELQVDGTSLGVYSGQLPELADGVHLVKITAYDRAGNSREAQTNVYIDTTPPGPVRNFRAVSGRNNISLRWEKPAEDVTGYTLLRQPAWGEGAILVTTEEYADSDLAADTAYTYVIMAMDHAQNLSEVVNCGIAVPGLAVVAYSQESGAVVEYAASSLVIPPASLPANIKTIIVTEIESPQLVQSAVNPLVSPIYDFSAIAEVDGSDTLLQHTTFEEEYHGFLGYDETLLPAGYPEENLDVYYYNTLWGHWMQEPGSVVDKENNRIYFKSSHFSSFSVQPTLIEDLSPQELSEAGYSPFQGKVNHGDVSISPEGGNAHVEVTELVLPGKNGFEFALKRTYDTVVARGDAMGASLGASLSLNLANLTDAASLADLARQAGMNLIFGSMGQFEDKLKQIWQSSGDFSYSMGQGWRLNLPYLRCSRGSVMLRLPDGSFHSLDEMDVVEHLLPLGIFRDMTLENHTSSDFKLEIVQIRGDVNITNLLRQRMDLDKTMSSLGAVASLENLSMSIEDFADKYMNGNTDFAGSVGFQFNEYMANNATNGLAGMFNLMSTAASLIPDWKMINAVLTLKDGSKYTFNNHGQVTMLEDTTGTNVLTFHYKASFGGQVPDLIELDYIQDSKGRRIKFEYTYPNSSTGQLDMPRISRIWVEGDSDYAREVNYTVGRANLTDYETDMALLEQAVQSGSKDGQPYKRTYDYEYGDMFLCSAGGSIEVNAVSIIADFFTLGAFSAISGWSQLSLSGNISFETFYPLSRMEGPGTGIIALNTASENVVYTDVGLTNYLLGFIPTTIQLEYHSGFKIFTQRVERYKEDGQTIDWFADYGYSFNYADHGQHYTSSSRINENDILLTENTYAWRSREARKYLDWTDAAVDLLEGRLLVTKEYEIETSNIQTQVKDMASGRVLETTTYEWSDDWDKLESVTRLRAADNYSTTTYNYDSWGNPTLVREETVTGVHTSKVEKWSYYNTTTDEPKPEIFTDQENPYATEHSNLDSPGRHDLLLGQIVRSYKTGGLPADVSVSDYSDQVSFSTYNIFGQLTDSKVFNPDYGWLETTYTYDDADCSLTQAVNEDASLVRIVKNKGTAEEHIVDIAYDYDSSADFYYVTSTEQVSTPDGADNQEVKSITAYEKQYNWPAWSTNPRGYTTRYTYDPFGRLTKIAKPAEDETPDFTLYAARPETGTLNPQTTIAYDDESFTVSVTEKVDATNSTAVTYDYTNRGKLAEIRRSYYDYTYDPVNRSALRQGDAREITLSLTYTPNEQIKSLTRPVTDSLTATVEYAYDSQGTLSLETYTGFSADVQRGVQNRNYKEYSYDYTTNTRTMINELGNKVEETYDLQGHLLSSRIYKWGDEIITTTSYYNSQGQPLLTIDGNGNRMANAYNALGQLTRQILPNNDNLAEDYSFWYEGAALSGVNPTIEYTYNRSGVKKAEILGYTGMPEAEKIRTVFTIDELGRTYRTSRSYSTHVDIDNLTPESDWSAATTTVNIVEEIYYDANGNIVKTTDGNNMAKPVEEREYRTVSYTPRDQVARETTPAGTTTYTYNLQDNPLTMVNPLGNAKDASNEAKYSGEFAMKNYYDELSRLVVAIQPKGKNQSENPVICYQYYPGNKLQKETDLTAGSVKEYDYNIRGWLSEEVLRDTAGTPVEYKSSYKYDAAGNQVEVTDNLENTTRMYYDKLARLIRTEYPGGIMQDLYAYDNNGNQTLAITGKNETRTSYDTANRPCKITMGTTTKATYWYDYLGNQTRFDNGKDYSYQYTYDQLGRMVSSEEEAGYVRYYAYDRNNNKVFSKDANGIRGIYNYDNVNNLTSVAVADSTKTQNIAYTYDEAGGIKTVTADGVVSRYNNETGTYQPDPYGRLTYVSTQAGSRNLNLGQNYDAVGRLSGLVYPDGKSVTYTYNACGQLSGMPGYLDGSPQYNANGQLKNFTTRNGVHYNYEYDDLMRLENLSYEKNDEELKAFAYKYNTEGNISYINKSYYHYDQYNQLDNAILNGKFEVDVADKAQTIGRMEDDFTGQKELSFSYSPEEVELKLDYASMSIGVDLGGTYEVSRLKIYPQAATHRVEKQHLALFIAKGGSMGYEKIDDSEWILETDDTGVMEIRLRLPVEAQFMKLHCYYDDRDADDIPQEDRVSVRNDRQEIIRVYYMVDWRTETYSYDNNGNRLTSSTLLAGEEAETNSYQYYGKTDRLLSDGTYAYTWDANGNLVEKGDAFSIVAGTQQVTYSTNSGEYWLYEYDLFNQLIKVRKSEVGKDENALEDIAGYTYDGSHLRIRKENLQTGVITWYTYTPTGVLLFEEVENVEGGDEYSRFVYAAANVLAKEVGNVDDGSGIAVYTKEATWYYQTDHLGSTVMITDEAGRIVWQDEVTPFGISGGAVGLLDERALFTGKQLDEDVGFYYFNARWYDAGTGRFISEDFALDGANWYVYVGNNPLVFVDPTGMINIRIIAPDGNAIGEMDDQFYHTDNSSISGFYGGTLGADFNPTADDEIEIAPNIKMSQSEGLVIEMSYETGRLLASAIDIGTDFIPIVGEIKDAAKIFMKIANGEEVSAFEVGMLLASVVELDKAFDLGKQVLKLGDASKAALKNSDELLEIGQQAFKNGDEVDGLVRYLPDGGSPSNVTNARTRFFGDANGNTVDIDATPQGRWMQPDGSATDILQKSTHDGKNTFESYTHTHPIEININPNNPERSSRKLSKDVNPVTVKEILNIMNNLAAKAKPKGRG